MGVEILYMVRFEQRFDSFVRTHWELFPNNREITSDLVDELKDLALHAASGWLNLPLTSSSLYDDSQTL